jgi:hypothetical protein
MLRHNFYGDIGVIVRIMPCEGVGTGAEPVYHPIFMPYPHETFDYKPIYNVGELKKMIADLPDDAAVCLTCCDQRSPSFACAENVECGFGESGLRGIDPKTGEVRNWQIKELAIRPIRR